MGTPPTRCAQPAREDSADPGQPNRLSLPQSICRRMKVGMSRSVADGRVTTRDGILLIDAEAECPDPALSVGRSG